MTTKLTTDAVPAPDVVRCAYMEIQVTNLKAAREFYVDILGLVVTCLLYTSPSPRDRG